MVMGGANRALLAACYRPWPVRAGERLPRRRAAQGDPEKGVVYGGP